MTAARVALPFELPTPRERAELILGQLDQLPTLPAVAAKLLRMTTSDSTSAAEVTRIIESDAGLTAAILRLVRRADLGVRAETITVARAVPLLGFRAVRNAVLSLKLHASFVNAQEPPGTAANRRELWKHSLAVACAAELLAECVTPRPDAGQAFVCGLLHDIGKMALGACLPKSYARAVDRADRYRRCICDEEHELFGLDHTVAGKRLAARWELPESVVECAWLHHHSPDALPARLSARPLVQIVHLADRLVRRQRIGYSGYLDSGDLLDDASVLGIDDQTIASVAGQLLARMEPYCELVGLDDVNSATLSAESLAKANEELARLNADLAESNRRLELRSTSFDLLRQFNELLTERGSASDVCAAAAQAVCQVLDRPRALVFSRDDAMRLVHVGGFDQRTQHRFRQVIDPAELGATAGDDAASGERSPAMGLADPASAAMWRACGGDPGASKLVLFPIGHPGGGAGGVLFEDDGAILERWREAAMECQSVAHAIGLAVAYAHVHDRAERTNEDLVDAHRRLRQAQANLVRSRSVGMIAKMADGAAHEINNPLAIISGRAQLLRQDVQSAHAVKALDVIAEQARRASDIASELMSFAKPDPPAPTLQRLPELIDASLEHWRASPEAARARWESGIVDPDATVFVDIGQFRIVMDAILSNAVQSLPTEGGVIHVNSPASASDDMVRLVIRDNGCGMSPDVLEHAIDPFFSHRPAGRGRGLGLSRTYRLTELNGGRLDLESAVGVGTTVTLDFPRRAPGA